MKHAETVTFGTSGLDRAAHLRADGAAIEALLQKPSSRAVLFWRGKPLLDAQAGLVRLALDHPILKDAHWPRMFVGLDDGVGCFAFDMSAWDPADLETEELGKFIDMSEQKHPDLPDAFSFREIRSVLAELSRRDAEIAATVRAIMAWHDSHMFCAKCGAASDMVMEGWQRSCPDCGAQHFPRTDPVVIMLITHGNRTLLGRSPGWPEGMYSCLAGFVEPGETIESAVRRETFEEAGVRVGEVAYLSSQPWPFPASLMFGCKGEALNLSLDIDANEIESALWITREELAEAFAGQHPHVLPARKGSIAHFLLENWLADTLE